eukprot:760749-Hanusia_phi.AAC.6
MIASLKGTWLFPVLLMCTAGILGMIAVLSFVPDTDELLTRTLRRRSGEIDHVDGAARAAKFMRNLRSRERNMRNLVQLHGSTDGDDRGMQRKIQFQRTILAGDENSSNTEEPPYGESNALPPPACNITEIYNCYADFLVGI